MSHPPFAHNPHVYDGVDPDANPVTAMVVHSHVAGEDGQVDGEQGDAVNADTGVVTPAGEPLPAADPTWPDGSADTSATSPEDAPVDVDGDGETTGYEMFSKADLVAECEARGLLVSGNKPDLVARLIEHDNTTTTVEPDSE